jgi:hypothetical protein
MAIDFQGSRLNVGVDSDPADYANFWHSLYGAAKPLDFRTDAQLELVALDDASPVHREQACFELMTRLGPGALPFLRKALTAEQNSMVRQNIVWAIEKTGHPEALATLEQAALDDDVDVAEWSSIFVEELSNRGGHVGFEKIRRPARSLEGKTFDETLYLHITCDMYVRLDLDGSTWGRIRLSPLGLAQVFGQAYACPMISTRNQEIVIAKNLTGLLPDDKDYYETFLFRGFTERTQPTRGNFYFESSGNRVFFPSGKAEDFSQGVIEDVPITFARYGSWFLDPNLSLHNELPIRYVRGTFQGWGYLDIQRALEDDMGPLAPGNGLLSTLHHPEVGPMTNTFIVGTFKGRLRDVDGDGVLEYNPFDVHSTRAGEVDSNCDGIADKPGVTQSSAAYFPV